MTVLELKAQHDALQRIATTRDPIRAISEFVWNALDADATSVSVDLERNSLGGLTAVVITDNLLGGNLKRMSNSHNPFAWPYPEQNDQVSDLL